MNKLTIAVTGASGYIGSHLCDFLQKQGHVIYKMGRHASNADDSNFINFELGKENCLEHLQDVDALIHCAYDFSITHAQKNRCVNFNGSMDLFHQAKTLGVKKILFLSSTSAFEKTTSNYGKVKYEIEQHAKKMGVTIIRPGLVFNENAGGIIGALNKFISKSFAAPIIGNGQQLFFPCHIQDLFSVIEHLLKNDLVIKEPITAASESAITFKELLQTIAHRHEKKLLLIPIPYHLFYLSLKIAELMGIKLGFRSDSLKYMQHYNQSPNFEPLKLIAIHFRPLTVKTLGSVKK